MRKFTVVLLLTSILYSCDRDNTNKTSTYQRVWVPIYAQATETSNSAIVMKAPEPTVTAGKIYVYNQYVLQNEQYKGFHIIDHSNPSNPVKVGFLNVPFSTEIAIKNNHLYTNIVSDLAVINIANIMSPTVVKRVANAFPIIDQKYPPVTGYFQCTDPSKGIVVRWEEKSNLPAKCRR